MIFSLPVPLMTLNSLQFMSSGMAEFLSTAPHSAVVKKESMDVGLGPILHH